MAKDKTAALEHAKKSTTKGKKSAKGATSRSALPPGWIQGDWIPLSISAEDLERLVANGLIAPESWRLREGEFEPAPRDGEQVLLTTHVERCFSLPPHPFFRGFLNFFGAQIHHFPPKGLPLT